MKFKVMTAIFAHGRWCMFHRLARPVRPLTIMLLLATLLGLGLSFHGGTRPAQAQQANRVSVVLRWLDAEPLGDLNTAVAQFADNAVFIGPTPTGNCSEQTPCTDVAGISQQIQGNITTHNCTTLRNIQVAGAVVTGEREIQNDVIRAHGVQRILQSFIAVVPQDQMTFFAGVFDVADPQTALNVDINAGRQPAGTPLSAPTTPCPGLL